MFSRRIHWESKRRDRDLQSVIDALATSLSALFHLHGRCAAVNYLSVRSVTMIQWCSFTKRQYCIRFARADRSKLSFAWLTESQWFSRVTILLCSELSSAYCFFVCALRTKSRRSNWTSRWTISNENVVVLGHAAVYDSPENSNEILNSIWHRHNTIFDDNVQKVLLKLSRWSLVKH